jgi:hypothetical protein
MRLNHPASGRVVVGGFVMIDLIVETGLGHDPDDFFTLCYLAAAGVRLRAITVVPGDRDQLADEAGDWVLADVDREALWHCFRGWK